jgi:hypothetical protein
MDQIPKKRSNLQSFFGERNILEQLMPYKPTSTLRFGRFLLFQKIWSINGLVNAR